ncbi:uncharacterized protein MELLADRAFT_94104 [Melampsora larici-populina 98AG31]|uniref:Secreted protein n=1 Tax=Melampsora larici-populina (strain 98AG31 / pathotype 3-4-7) TaxID=747676 RepID=F4S6E9_MELLP|nr:uncharacterized protein MELLADRAFT_94104 [Melampsora larici-populina 98AG31]EGF99805.1 hypothetical protein MELLADRAFT_94104 [Melampsora larici-populina 98AG31]
MMHLILFINTLFRIIPRCTADLNVGGVNERQSVGFQSQVKILGGVSRTKLQYPDGLTIDSFSTSEHNMTISINNSPLATPLFVTAIDPSTSALSGTWSKLSNYSYTLNFEVEDPDDLIMDIAARIQLNGISDITEDNVFLAKYHKERQGWVVDFERATFHRTKNQIGSLGISNPAGEYLVVGRCTNGAYNTFLPINDGVFEVIGSPASVSQNTIYPLQIGTWSDGTRVMVRSQEALSISASLAVISDGFLPVGYQAVGTYVHVLQTKVEKGEVELRLQLPTVRSRLLSHQIHPNQLHICKRDLQDSSGPCRIVSPAVPAGTGALMTKAIIGVEGYYLLVTPESQSMLGYQNQNGTQREGIECENGNSTTVNGRKMCGLIEGESMTGSEVEG